MSVVDVIQAQLYLTVSY